MPRVNVALIIAYHGALYDGWQDNGANRSIEGLLKKAFYALYQTSITLDAASRTDKGVHALNQVVIAKIPEDKIPLSKLALALNAKLPPSIRVKMVTLIPLEFHPSLSCKQKTYSYNLNLKQIPLPFDHDISWHTPDLINLEAMKEAFSHFLGTKDFSSFSNSIDKPSVDPFCRLDKIELIDSGNQMLTLEITADRFLYKMCRIIVGTLAACGKNQISPHQIKEIFHKKNRLHAGITAPACGLFLKTINYPGFDILNENIN